jgi:hypothetical protein
MNIAGSKRHKSGSRAIQISVVVDFASSDEKHEKIQSNALRIA